MSGWWSISERGRSSNSGRRIQWEPGAVPEWWTISARGRSSNSGRRIQWELEPSAVTEGVAAATLAIDRYGSRRAHRRWNHFRQGVWSGNGGGSIHKRAAGAPGCAIVFARTTTLAAGPVTSAAARSRAQSPGVSRTFTLLAVEEDILRTLAQPNSAFCDLEELPAGSTHLLDSPETYEQAHAGPHDRIWAKVERKEGEGLSAVGTFVEKVGT